MEHQSQAPCPRVTGWRVGLCASRTRVGYCVRPPGRSDSGREPSKDAAPTTFTDVTLKTFRVRLRPIAPSDADRIHEWAAQPEACRYQPWGPNTYADTEAFVAEAVRAWQVRPQQRWAGAATDPSDLVLGNGGVKLRGHGRAEISYAVHVDLWGQGIGSAIGHLLTAWAFEHLRNLSGLKAPATRATPPQRRCCGTSA